MSLRPRTAGGSPSSSPGASPRKATGTNVAKPTPPGLNKRPKKKNMTGYQIYIHKLAKYVYGKDSHHISAKGMAVLNAMCVDLNGRMNRQANFIVDNSRTATRSEAVLGSTLKLVFPGDHFPDVLSYVQKAITKYKNTLPVKVKKAAVKKTNKKTNKGKTPR